MNGFCMSKGTDEDSEDGLKPSRREDSGLLRRKAVGAEKNGMI